MGAGGEGAAVGWEGVPVTADGGYRVGIDTVAAPGQWAIIGPDRGPLAGGVIAGVSDYRLAAVIVEALEKLRGWIE